MARKEAAILDETVQIDDRSLILREPQLQLAKATVASAESSLQSAQAAIEAAKAVLASAETALTKAELGLRRTSLRAPFNAAVKVKDIDLGSQVSAGAPVATLIGTDEYWVRLSVPVDELGWIDVPGLNAPTGSGVRIRVGAGRSASVRQGRVARLLTDLEPQGRMARVLVAVDDPLSLKNTGQAPGPLLLGAYVRVEIAGRSAPDVVVVPRAALRDGENVWIMTPGKTLAIRPVTIAWSSNHSVYVSAGLSMGDELIVTDLAAAVAGMPLRTADSEPSRSASRPGRKEGASREGGGR